MKNEKENLSMPETNEIAVISPDTASGDMLSTLLNAGSEFFCSIPDDGSRAAKIRIYNAVQSASEEIGNHIGEVLEIVNVVAYPIDVVNDDGEKMNILRTILIDKNGVAYTAGSVGITNSLARIFALIGSPVDGAWEKEPVKMKIRQQTTRNGNKVNYIELVG